MNGAAADRLERAEDFYRDFHWGHEAKRSIPVKVPKTPRTLVQLGRLEAVEYTTNKKGDGPSTYRHKFGEEGGRRPRLAVDIESRRLHVVGGDYTIEPRGIVD
jgi:hypothetical protein